MEQGLALLVDFDETACQDNVAELLLSAFARDGWRELQARFRQRQLTLRQYQERAYAMVTAPVEEMARYAADRARLRPGFKDLVSWCRQASVSMAVVSGGLDFYVAAVLQQHGLGQVPIFTAGTRYFPDGPRFFYPHVTSTCSQWCTCKCAVIEGFRQKGRRVVFIGDGLVDTCPSGRAHFVFARSRLLEHCRQRLVPHQPFEDFHDVLRALCSADHPIYSAVNGHFPASPSGG